MSTHPKTCFVCEDGLYQEISEEYHFDMPDGKTLTMPKLLILRCGKCGEEAIPPESSRLIDSCRIATCIRR